MDRVIKFIIQKNEGGYVSPERAKEIGDTGGETNFGISKKSYPGLDIKNLTIDQAVEIYRKDYASRLPSIADANLYYQVLDMAINAGPSVALKLYKPGMTVQQYKDARLATYATFKLWANSAVRKSWTNRVNRLFV